MTKLLLPEFKRRLTRALRSGKYVQTSGVMQRRFGNENEMFPRDTHCFYGVWLDLATNGAGWTPASLDGSHNGPSQYHTHQGGQSRSNPPFGEDEMDWWEETTGIRETDPTVVLTELECSWHPGSVSPGMPISLMGLNDKGYTFPELSAIVDRAL